MILLWGVAGDAPFDDVRNALSSLGADVHVHDQRLNAACDVQLSCAPDRGRLRGTLTYDCSTQPAISLEEVRAVYVRPYSTQEVCRASSSPGTPSYERAMRSDLALLTWADLGDALVVNRPAAMAANGSKPFQLAMIATHGFAVPDTLITTDADEVRAFWAQHERLIYKSVSGVRSIVSQLGATHVDRLDDVASGPTQFQQVRAGRRCSSPRDRLVDLRHGGDQRRRRLSLRLAPRCRCRVGAVPAAGRRGRSLRIDGPRNGADRRRRRPSTHAG